MLHDSLKNKHYMPGTGDILVWDHVRQVTEIFRTAALFSINVIPKLINSQAARSVTTFKTQ